MHLRGMVEERQAGPGPLVDDAILVGRFRARAAHARRAGEFDEALALELVAAELARGVLRRYAGDGRWWAVSRRDGELVDPVAAFIAVGGGMPEFLDVRQRGELVTVALRHADDERAGALAYPLCRLGRTDLALALLGDPPSQSVIG